MGAELPLLKNPGFPGRLYPTALHGGQAHSPEGGAPAYMKAAAQTGTACLPAAIRALQSRVFRQVKEDEVDGVLDAVSDDGNGEVAAGA